MASTVFTLPFLPALGTNGTTQSGAKLYFYDAGTLTPRSVYTDAALSVPHTNPVVADGSGRFAAIYIDPGISYRIILKDSAGVQIGDIDNYTLDPVTANLAASGGSDMVGFIQSEAGAVARTAQDRLRETISLDDFGTASDANAQAAIDALPSIGGTVFVGGDWSSITPANLTVATNKEITWVLGRGGSLPDDMPGAVVTSGYRDQPHEDSAGTGTRPGSAMVRYLATDHTPDTATANQQDSVVYIEGHVPAADASLDQEFAGLRFNMSSEAFRTGTNQPSVDIKGVQGVTVGDSGGAKVRSIRVTSVGINGHHGYVTGIMAAAHRSGVIPTESPFSGNGTDEWASGDAGPYLTGDAAIIGQVGPGIEAAFRMEGFAGQERPSYGFLQARGTQALLPENAVAYLHGGGNGDVLRVDASESDNTQIFNVHKTGRLHHRGQYSYLLTVADDAATSITPPQTTGFIAVHAQGTVQNWVVRYFRTSGGAGMVSVASGSLGASTTGALTGTTGVDGNLTISADTSLIYIENRSGASRTVVVTFLST